MRRYASLVRRGDFARLRARGRRTPTPSFTIYLADSSPRDPAALVGITVKKSIGGAVVRNRLRRQIKAILDEILTADRAKLRVLIVARPEAVNRPFAALRAELLGALAS